MGAALLAGTTIINFPKRLQKGDRARKLGCVNKHGEQMQQEVDYQTTLAQAA